MNRFFKNITVFGMLFVLLVSTLGMSVNTLYCYCKGELEYSLFGFDGENHCDKKEEIAIIPSCCQKEVKKKSCCKSELEKKPCTKKGSVYVKLNVDYLIPHFDLQKIQVLDIDGIPPFNPIHFSKKNILANNTTLIAYNPNKAPPPKPYGKELCVFVQSFLC